MTRQSKTYNTQIIATVWLVYVHVFDVYKKKMFSFYANRPGPTNL